MHEVHGAKVVVPVAQPLLQWHLLQCMKAGDQTAELFAILRTAFADAEQIDTFDSWKQPFAVALSQVAQKSFVTMDAVIHDFTQEMTQVHLFDYINSNG